MRTDDGVSGSARPEEYRFAGFRLNVPSRRLTDESGRAINISSRALSALLVLIRHQGEPVSKESLLEAVWPGVIVEENNLSQAISSLRKALRDSRTEPRFIQTIPGFGYCFVAEAGPAAVTVLDDRSEPSGPDPAGREAVYPAARPRADPSEPFLRKRGHLVLFSLLVVSALAATVLSIRGNGDGEPVLGRSGLPVAASQADAGVIPDSVAVMPFRNLNASADDHLFTVSLHDAIINQLSKVESLRVISRENVLALGNRQTSPGELRRLLKVQSVIAGTVMYLGDKVQVSLQMQDPASGVILWASSYEADRTGLESMLAMQDDIALNVAQALEVETGRRAHDAVGMSSTESFEAYRYYLAARNAYYSRDYAKTWSLAQEAIALDPGYLDAQHLFSWVNSVMTGAPLAGMSPRDHYLRAMESAERVIALDPDSHVGYVLKATAFGTAGDWERVRREVDSLIDRGTPLAELKFYAPVLLCLGDYEGAIRILEANLRTEPVNLYGRGFLMAAYEMAGERELARREYLLGEELNPVWWGDTVNLFLDLGRGESLEDLEDIDISEPLKDLLRRLDDPERVARGLETYQRQAVEVPAEAMYYSAVAATAGEHELAIEVLREGLNGVWLGIHWLWLPVFDETRRTQEFRDLLVESGIVDYWRRYGWPEVCRPTEGEQFECDWRAYPPPEGAY